MKLRYCLVLLFATSLMAGTTPRKHRPAPKMKRPAAKLLIEPSPQRIAEIQAALRAHGYDSGSTWEETQEVCKRIADRHMWQTDHSPDVRVLILIGLGGPHSDSTVAQMSGGRLDKDQRSEAAREKQSLARR
jgi:hypothetical protein